MSCSLTCSSSSNLSICLSLVSLARTSTLQASLVVSEALKPKHAMRCLITRNRSQESDMIIKSIIQLKSLLYIPSYKTSCIVTSINDAFIGNWSNRCVVECQTFFGTEKISPHKHLFSTALTYSINIYVETWQRRNHFM